MKIVEYTHQTEAVQNEDGAWVCEIRTFIGELVTLVYGNDKEEAEARARTWTNKMNAE